VVVERQAVCFRTARSAAAWGSGGGRDQVTTDKTPRGRLAMMQTEAALAETGYCSRCGRFLAHWYYGFPLPECAYCQELSRRARFGSQVEIIRPELIYLAPTNRFPQVPFARQGA
jgi:hypothetical protein